MIWYSWRKRCLVAFGLALAALLMLSPPFLGKAEGAVLQGADNAVLFQLNGGAAGSEGEFDPFGLLPDGVPSDPDKAIFGQMPDMRLMRRALEIIGDTTDFSNLTAEQWKALAALGVDEKALTENAELLKSLIQNDLANIEAPSLFQKWGLPILLAAVLIFLSGVYGCRLRRRH